MKTLHRLLALTLALSCLAPLAPAQTLETIYRWQVNGRQTEAPVVKAPDGNFYGVTTFGGANDQGVIYRVNAAGNYAVLFNFHLNSTLPAAERPGAQPIGGLIVGNDGALYGTTTAGGQFGNGTLFRFTTAGAFSVVHAFGGSDGSQPHGTLALGADGNLYGTTYSGGATFNGTIFKCTPTGMLTTLHSFTGGAGGRQPRAGVIIGSDGHLYGTTRSGGTAGSHGTVWQLTQPGNVFTVLRAFAGGAAEGSDPWAGLVESGGVFYGVTSGGGAASSGTIFSVTSAGAFATVHHFNGGSGINSTGSTPYGGLMVASDGQIYGTTYSGGFQTLGCVFRFVHGTGVTVLKSFLGDDGMNPQAPLVDGGDGFLYGTTRQNAGNGARGVIFRLGLAGGFTRLSTQPDLGRVGFGNFSDEPTAGLIKGTDGFFYGVTNHGGLFDRGTVFKLLPNGGHTVLHSFNFTHGANPRGELVEAGAPGDFFGTTILGGSTGGHGTLYKITSAGAHAVLLNFDGSSNPGTPQFPTVPYGGSPISRLIDGGDGFFTASAQRLAGQAEPASFSGKRLRAVQRRWRRFSSRSAISR